MTFSGKGEKGNPAIGKAPWDCRPRAGHQCGGPGRGLVVVWNQVGLRNIAYVALAKGRLELFVGARSVDVTTCVDLIAVAGSGLFWLGRHVPGEASGDVRRDVG